MLIVWRLFIILYFQIFWNCEANAGVIQSSVTSIGTWLAVQDETNRTTKNCNDACEAISLPCNYANIHLISVTEMKTKIREMLPDQTCVNSAESTTIVTDNYKYHKETFDPFFNTANYCSSGFEKIGYSHPYPVCETKGKTFARRICQCGNSNVTDSDTSIGSKLVAQDLRTDAGKSCNDTCTAAGMLCNFTNFETIPLDELKNKIRNLLPREKCPNEASVIVTNGWKNYNSAFDPSFNKDNFCVAGYTGISETKFPKCNATGTSQSIRICQCLKAISSTTASETTTQNTSETTTSATTSETTTSATTSETTTSEPTSAVSIETSSNASTSSDSSNANDTMTTTNS